MGGRERHPSGSNTPETRTKTKTRWRGNRFVFCTSRTHSWLSLAFNTYYSQQRSMYVSPQRVDTPLSAHGTPIGHCVDTDGQCSQRFADLKYSIRDMDTQGGRQAQNNRIWNDSVQRDVENQLERTRDKCFDFGRTVTEKKISDISTKSEIEIFWTHCTKHSLTNFILKAEWAYQRQENPWLT